jgi:hypothetical protein
MGWYGLCKKDDCFGCEDTVYDEAIETIVQNEIKAAKAEARKEVA